MSDWKYTFTTMSRRRIVVHPYTGSRTEQVQQLVFVRGELWAVVAHPSKPMAEQTWERVPMHVNQHFSRWVVSTVEREILE